MEKPKFEELFEQAISYPDPDYGDRLNALVGLDSHKAQLTKILSLLVNPDGIKLWAQKHHPSANKTVEMILRRPPLVVLEGDVGSGKSELAFTISDAVARQEKINITLLPLSLSTRGNGMVGQMTQLISTAFEYTIEMAKKLKSQSNKSRGAVILLVDEADALAQSRESSQMNHEDKAGVNAFIRGIDSLGNGQFPAAVIMCTNRLGALDPAIKRRAADIFRFKRPDADQRMSVLQTPLTELGLSENEIKKMVELTGEQENRSYGFTFSDLVQRLIPSIVLDAYPNNAVTTSKALEIASNIIPTPPFKEIGI